MKFTRRSIGSMTIGKKLFLSFGTAMALTLLIALVGSVANAVLSSTVERVAQSTSVRQSLAYEISYNFAELLSLERGMNLRALMKDSASAEAYDREFLTDSAKLAVLLKQLAPMLSSADDTELCAELTAQNLQLRHLHDQAFRKIASSVPDAAYSFQVGSPYQIYRDVFLPEGKLTKSKATHLLEDQRALIVLDASRARRTEVRSRWLTNLMLILFFVVGGVLSHIVVQSNRTLRHFAAELGQGASQIAAAAAQVSSSSHSLARAASEQAAFIEATSVSAEEINSMASHNTDNAQATAGMVAESQRSIHEGNRALDQMVAAMDGIALSSKEISKIVSLIDQMAFQTNILALNAAVEAARAGDSGLSFAVVAGEVRELAQRSAQAAKDTAVLIEDCLVKSQTGKLQVDKAAAAIHSITAQSARVKLLVDEISAGSREQSRGIDQVSKAVLQMEQVTQGTAAGAEQSAAAAKQLDLQFQTLKHIADDLAAMLGPALGKNAIRKDAAPENMGSPPPVKPATFRHLASSSEPAPDELEAPVETVLRL